MSKPKLKWNNYKWPKWVPAEIRKQIEHFWCPSSGRGPDAWEEDNIQQRTPKTGQMLIAKDMCSNREAFGKWVHCWNNIGRLVLANGTFLYTSTCEIIQEVRDERVTAE